jgi:phage repressor protein C with HTH and peptisase S24 domain
MLSQRAYRPQSEIPGYVSVARLAVNVEGEFGEPILLPEDLIRGELYGKPGDFICMKVDGPTMSPLLEDGDQVLVDRRSMPVADPGLFAVDEGGGLVVKWLAALGDGDRQWYRLWTEECPAATYTVSANRIQIVGRLVWAGRLL